MRKCVETVETEVGLNPFQRSTAGSSLAGLAWSTDFREGGLVKHRDIEIGWVEHRSWRGWVQAKRGPNQSCWMQRGQVATQVVDGGHAV